METKYIRTTEVAKLIRKDLKKNFPKTKFSVQSESYSGGSAINVYWTDGVTDKQVKEVIDKYKSTGFDGMIDMSFNYQHYQLPNGEIVFAGTEGTRNSMGVYPEVNVEKPEGAVLVSLGTGYLFTNRKLSKEIQLKTAKVMKEHYGDLEKIEEPKVEEDLNKNFQAFSNWYNWYQLTWKVLQKIDLTDVVGIEADPKFESGAMFEGFKAVGEVN